MCTIAFLVGVIAESPLVVAANRDELFARPTRPPEQLGDGLVGGVDVLSGGTWLAVRGDGRFAAVTNGMSRYARRAAPPNGGAEVDQRVMSTPPPGLRSRGLAVKELAAADDPDAYVREIDPTRYASMNLAWGDAHGVSIAYARQHGLLEVVPLPPGIHVLCNDRLGSPGFPRGDRLHAAISALVARAPSHDELLAGLGVALADHRRSVAAPDSTLPPDIAAALTATCIHSETYGTRSATMFAAGQGGARAYRHADGRPCTTPFVDRMALLEAA